MKWIYGFANVQGGKIYIGMNALKTTTQTTQLTTQTTQLSNLDKKIIEIIRKNPKFPQRKMAEELSVSYNTIRYHMDVMVESKVLIKHKEGRNSVWQVNV